MKYRDAKHLKSGDQVKLNGNNIFLIVSDVEILGSLNVVRINCNDADGKKITVYNSDIE